MRRHCSRLRRRGLPAALALLLVIAAVSLAGTAIVAIAGASIDEFQQALPEYRARLQEQTAGLGSWFEQHGLPMQRSWSEHLDPARIMTLAGGLFNGLGNMLANSFLIFLTVIFILLEATSFPGKLRQCLPSPEASMSRLRKVADSINHYLAIKTWTSLATGLIIAAGLALLGVDFPVLWGMLAFLLNFVPNIGAIIAAVPVLLLALVQLGTASAIWTLVLYLAVNNIIGNLVEPRFMGRRLGLSALVVFLSLVFWGWVLGPVGMFLSVPLTMTLKIGLESSSNALAGGAAGQRPRCTGGRRGTRRDRLIRGGPLCATWWSRARRRPNPAAAAPVRTAGNGR